MTLYRCFAWDRRAKAGTSDNPLWVPRPFQGDGRHDNPDQFGCLYLADRPLSCIVEQLARFRTQQLRPSFLIRRGLPLALATLDLSKDARIVDLDDPGMLRRRRLRPSQVATRDRTVTQPQARAIHETTTAAGLRWWSTHEASWINVTLFERAVPLLQVMAVRELSVGDPDVFAACEKLGIDHRA